MTSILIYARDQNYGIGKDGSIPWKDRNDLIHFFETTTKGEKNALICGTKTYESMKNIVLKNRKFYIVGKEFYPTLKNAFNAARKLCDKVFFIGGQRIYEECQDFIDDMYETVIDGDYNCDVKFEPNYRKFKFINSTNNINYYHRLHPDKEYNNLCVQILHQGIEKQNRTGINTISSFGHQIQFCLDPYFPILTTKKVFWSGVVKELIWFIKGQTDSKILEEQKVNIWKGNTTTEFLRNKDLLYREGDAGPIYGFQWRHWNATYFGCDNNYLGSGIDQLSNIIECLKADPDSRRMIMSAWNVSQLDKMALPPCHVMCQFYTSNGYLDCHMYQRSADVFLGLPFNISSYALLTYIIAHLTGYTPGKLIISIGDAHLYTNHLDQVKVQLERDFKKQCTLKINSQLNSINDICETDIILENYQSHPAIKAMMAV